MGIKISHISNKEIKEEECLFEPSEDYFDSIYDDEPSCYMDLDENGYCIPYLDQKERRQKSIDDILSEGTNNLKMYWPNK